MFVYLCVHMCMREKENFSPDSSVLSKKEVRFPYIENPSDLFLLAVPSQVWNRDITFGVGRLEGTWVRVTWIVGWGVWGPGQVWRGWFGNDRGGRWGKEPQDRSWVWTSWSRAGQEGWVGRGAEFLKGHPRRLVVCVVVSVTQLVGEQVNSIFTRCENGIFLQLVLLIEEVRHKAWAQMFKLVRLKLDVWRSGLMSTDANSPICCWLQQLVKMFGTFY